MSEKMKTIAVRKNANGEVLEVLEIKTYLETRAKELQNQAVSNSAKYESEKAEKLEKEKLERQALANKVSKHDLFVAKALFNDLVDKGEMETNDTFEKMFVDFIKGVNAYDESCEPRDFKKVLEGVSL